MKKFFIENKIKNLALIYIVVGMTLFFSCSNSQFNNTEVTIDTDIQLTAREIKDVKSYKITVSADDIKTISKTFTSSKISLTVENGKDRLFTLEALNEGGETIYEGSQTTDLVGGSSIEIVIKMNALDTDTDIDTDIDTDEPIIPITILVDGFGTFLTKPTLSWEPLENSSYKFRYAESKEALLTTEEKKCEINSYTFSEDLQPGTYYWQCCSVVNDKTSDWSEAVSFTINNMNDGSSSYNIGYAYDLYFISKNSLALKNKSFKLMADIDMNDLQEDQPFTPIVGFQVTFDGNNKTISNLKIDSTSDYIGLFNTTNGATIENLTLKDVYISGNSFVGGLVGKAENTNFSNCHVSGNITATGENVGGLAGKASSTNETKATIENCNSSISIEKEESSNNNWTGGLVGFAVLLIIKNCYNNGDVIGSSHVGGLVGRSDFSNIANCYNTGIITGNEKVGGLVGNNNEEGSLTNSYNMGDVNGNNYSGGLVGRNSSSVSNCYVAAGVHDKDENSIYFGALIGIIEQNGSVSNCYYDSKKCDYEGVGSGGSVENCGKATSQLQDEDTYSDWDFDNTWGIEPAKNNGYPYLLYM